MKNFLLILISLSIWSCREEKTENIFENRRIHLHIPSNFPKIQYDLESNYPTEYGVELGKKLFSDPRLSLDNTISCAKCHQRKFAFTDPSEIRTQRAVGVEGRIGMRNTPPIQNALFLDKYMWDGVITELHRQPIVPIVTDEEMGETLQNVENKIKDDPEYKILFKKAFGSDTFSRDGMLKAITQYMLTLISANSKYDKVIRNEGESFTAEEQKGLEIFKQKCASCHSTDLFTDQTLRNIGIPYNPETEDDGFRRGTGKQEDFLKFKVPSLRNVEYTAPYGRDGRYATLKDFLDFLTDGVQEYPNLDPEMRKYFAQTGKLGIPLTEDEKNALIAFMKTLSDEEFTGRK
ncbi:MAG: cytochrome c peroxidase [Capnocytophaga sp.]|nr:cytochrome c peroxidase [Capnocytophaga sp.]